MRISDWSSDVCSSDLGRAPSTSARHPLRVCAGRGQAATLLPLNPSGWPMPHHTSLIAMLVYGFVLAFIFGALANRLRLSPLVGYLLAGAVAGPFTPGLDPTHVVEGKSVSVRVDIGGLRRQTTKKRQA